MLVQLTRLERCRNLMMKGDLVGVGSHNAAHLVDHRVHRVTFKMHKVVLFVCTQG